MVDVYVPEPKVLRRENEVSLIDYFVTDVVFSRDSSVAVFNPSVGA